LTSPPQAEVALVAVVASEVATEVASVAVVASEVATEVASEAVVASEVVIEVASEVAEVASEEAIPLSLLIRASLFPLRTSP
jgi:hypothetical protein